MSKVAGEEAIAAIGEYVRQKADGSGGSGPATLPKGNVTRRVLEEGSDFTLSRGPYIETVNVPRQQINIYCTMGLSAEETPQEASLESGLSSDHYPPAQFPLNRIDPETMGISVNGITAQTMDSLVVNPDNSVSASFTLEGPGGAQARLDLVLQNTGEPDMYGNRLIRVDTEVTLLSGDPFWFTLYSVDFISLAGEELQERGYALSIALPRVIGSAEELKYKLVLETQQPGDNDELIEIAIELRLLADADPPPWSMASVNVIFGGIVLDYNMTGDISICQVWDGGTLHTVFMDYSFIEILHYADARAERVILMEVAE